MNQSLLPLIQNASLLLAMAVLADAMSPRRRMHGVLTGLLVGLTGICLMQSPWVIHEGLIFDTRSVLLAISGLYFGLVPTLIAAVMTSAMRLVYGGVAGWAGVSVIIASGAIGLLWRRWKGNRLSEITWVDLLSLGVVVHAVMILLLIGALPPHSVEAVLRDVALPIMAIYPIATLGLGALARNHLRRRQAAERLEHSEEQVRATLYGIGDGVISTDAAARVTRMNAVAERLTGWTERDAKGRPLQEVFRIAGEGPGASFQTPDRFMQDGKAHEEQAVLVSRDGTQRPIANNASPVKGPGGAAVGMVLVFRDQTEQRAARTALEESERRFRAVFEQAAVGAVEVDAKTGRHLRVNARYCRVLRYTDEQLLGMTFEQIIHPDDHPALREYGMHMLAGDIREFKAEARFIRSDGQVRWVSGVVAAMWEDGAEPTRMVATLQDTTDQKLAEAALQEAERFSRSTIDALPSLLCVLDERGRILATNAAWRRFREQTYGMTMPEVGASYVELCELAVGRHGEKAAKLAAGVRAVLSGEVQQYAQESSFKSIWFSVLATRFPGPGPLRVVVNHANVTPRKAAEQALAQSEARFRSFVESMPEAIFVQTAGRLRYANPAGLALLGAASPEDLLGRPVVDYVEAGKVAEVGERVRRLNDEGLKVSAYEHKVRRCDGSLVDVEVSAVPLQYEGESGGLLFARDVTERKQSEEALRKMSIELSFAEERERRRLAGILHDEVCQILSLAQIKLSVARQERDGEDAAPGETEQLIVRANRSLRSLMMQMSHPALYDLGISAAAEWLVEEVQRLYGVAVSLEDDRSFEGMDTRMRVLLFQCLRELLVNVAKHAGVEKAVVRMYSRQGLAFVEVEDHGRGFHVERLEKHASGGGFGLFAIRERLLNLRGNMEIEAKIGKGAKVILTVPLEKSTDGPSSVG